MSLFVTETIRGLKPYQPGKPIEETKREFGLDRVVKLASNENPLGPSPMAVKAIQSELLDLHRYPDGAAYQLKRSLAKRLSLEPRNIIIGNGSNDVLDFAVRTFSQPHFSGSNDKATLEYNIQLAQPEFSFIAFSICGLVHGVQTSSTRIHPDTFVPDLDHALEALKNPAVKIFYLANPNNPTGAFIPKSQVLGFLKKLSALRPKQDCLVLLDYAYGEYLESGLLPELKDCLECYSQVAITRTFSKIYGLGGLRVGYMYGPAELIEMMEKVRQPFNVSSLGLVGATAALEDHAFVKKSLESNEISKEFWQEKLASAGVRFIPSVSNFVLFRSKEKFGRSGIELFNDCLKNGLILRPVSNYGLHDWVRITFGTPDENEFAWSVLSKYLGRS